LGCPPDPHSGPFSGASPTGGRRFFVGGSRLSGCGSAQGARGPIDCGTCGVPGGKRGSALAFFDETSRREQTNFGRNRAGRASLTATDPTEHDAHEWRPDRGIGQGAPVHSPQVPLDRAPPPGSAVLGFARRRPRFSTSPIPDRSPRLRVPPRPYHEDLKDNEQSVRSLPLATDRARPPSPIPPFSHTPTRPLPQGEWHNL
jgi:hypothetical protein